MTLRPSRISTPAASFFRFATTEFIGSGLFHHQVVGFAGRCACCLSPFVCFHRVDAHQRVLLAGLINAHPVKSSFVDEIQIGLRRPAAVAYALVEDQIEGFGVRPLSVG